MPTATFRNVVLKEETQVETNCFVTSTAMLRPTLMSMSRR